METFFIFLLCDDIRRIIFSKLTIEELVRVEVVSKQWQRDVLEGLRQISRLIMRNLTHEIGFKAPPSSFCRIPGHQYVLSDIISKRLSYSQINALISKLPNLTTLYIDSNYIEIVELVVTTAFKNCPRLRHLDLPNEGTDLRQTLSKVDLSKLTCFANIATIDLKRFENLKFISKSPLTMEDIVVLLKTGLIGISAIDELDYSTLKRAIFEHGRNLQVLDVEQSVKGEFIENFDERDIQKISEHCKYLKEIRIFGPSSVLQRLECASNLEILHLCNWRLTKDYFQVMIFGHRLKKLTVMHIACNDGSMIAELNQTCPNLKELVCTEMSLIWSSTIEPNLGSSPYLISFSGRFGANEIQTRTFLNAFPNLRLFSSSFFLDETKHIHDVRNWIKKMKSDFSTVRFEIFKVHGRIPSVVCLQAIAHHANL